MKQKLILLAALVFILLSTPLFAEFVFLTNGAIIEGKIIKDGDDTITIRTNDRKTVEIRRNTIMRILYTDLYMGKIFVNKIDGTVLEVYMVDENKDTFTFRKDLFKPEEFTLRRDEVLYTVRTNPVALKGVVDKQTVRIDWKAPYISVKKYRVYINSGDGYKLYSETSSAKETLRKLKSNTNYFIKVTAIGKDGVETQPSNEIKVLTPNIPPDAPVKLKAAKKVDDKNKKMDVTLSWETPADIDGKIKSYNIYQKGNPEIFISKKNEIEIKNLDPGKAYTFNVTAVDDHKDESKKSRRVKIAGYDYKGYDLTILPAFILPFGTFKEIHDFGAGVTVSGVRENTFIKNLDIGVDTGYWQYKGADFDKLEITYSIMLPFCVTAGYRFNFFSSLYVIPHIAIGGSLNYIIYDGEPDVFIKDDSYLEEKSAVSFEPMLLAGASFEYDVSKKIYAAARADFGMITETGGLMFFAAMGIGCGYRF
ncbi:MAG: fibronectin type III domain-containing protein [Spirochaetes bacterium]|nr:fibronectin type III domain-containing protein [Spirochaetota bacterium]